MVHGVSKSLAAVLVAGLLLWACGSEEVRTDEPELANPQPAVQPAAPPDTGGPRVTGEWRGTPPVAFSHSRETASGPRGFRFRYPAQWKRTETPGKDGFSVTLNDGDTHVTVAWRYYAGTTVNPAQLLEETASTIADLYSESLDPPRFALETKPPHEALQPTEVKTEFPPTAWIRSKPARAFTLPSLAGVANAIGERTTMLWKGRSYVVLIEAVTHRDNSLTLTYIVPEDDWYVFAYYRQWLEASLQLRTRAEEQKRERAANAKPAE